MADDRQPVRAVATFAAGAVIGAVEVVLAISFAALVFGGYLAYFLSAGIGLYLVAAAITLAIVATTTALDAFGSLDRAFLTVVAATMVVRDGRRGRPVHGGATDRRRGGRDAERVAAHRSRCDRAAGSRRPRGGALHRWFATTLAQRLAGTTQAFDTLLD